MSDVDSLYSFEDDTGQPDAAADTSYSNEWPLPERGGGASPRARSPRSDGASTTAALSFSTAAASAEARLEADAVEAVAAPGAGAVDAEEDDILDRLRSEQAFPRRGAVASFDGSDGASYSADFASPRASEDASTPGRRSFATAADACASADGEHPAESDDGTDASDADPATEETPPQSPRASDSSEDFAAASGSHGGGLLDLFAPPPTPIALGVLDVLGAAPTVPAAAGGEWCIDAATVETFSAMFAGACAAQGPGVDRLGKAEAGAVLSLSGLPTEVPS